MKIAVTYENGNVFQHFGHSKYFKFYTVDDGKVVSSEVVSTDGQGHGALSKLLSENKVDVLICGGIGGGARNCLDEVGIKLYGGVSGKADDAVAALLAGNIKFNPDVKCSHHDGGEHTCGGHTCGEHDCNSHK